MRLLSGSLLLNLGGILAKSYLFFWCLMKTIYGQHRQVDKVVMWLLTIRSKSHRIKLSESNAKELYL
jgi:hypothetical protein